MREPRSNDLEDRIDRVESVLLRLSEAQADTAAQVAALATAQRRTEERLDQLTARVDELAAAQVRTEQRLDQLTTRIDELAMRIDQLAASVHELAAAQARTEQRLDQLVVRMDALAVSMDKLALAQAKTDVRLGALNGWVLQARYRERAHAYFQTILRRIRVVSMGELAKMADDAEEQRRISAVDRGDLLNADLVIRGRLPDQTGEAYLVAEVSVAVDARDVNRAARRAEVLQKLVDVPVIAAAAGTRLRIDGQHEAKRLGVQPVIHAAEIEEVA